MLDQSTHLNLSLSKYRHYAVHDPSNSHANDSICYMDQGTFEH